MWRWVKGESCVSAVGTETNGVEAGECRLEDGEELGIWVAEGSSIGELPNCLMVTVCKALDDDVGDP